jgi:hypothetical protein
MEGIKAQLTSNTDDKFVSFDVQFKNKNLKAITLFQKVHTLQVWRLSS